MRVLLVVLVVGIAGCGGGDHSPDEGAVPTPKSSQAKTDKSPAQTANADAIAALKKFGARIKQNEQGEVVEVMLTGTNSTDAGLLHLKGMTKLQTLYLNQNQITDAGLVHLKRLANLENLGLGGTKVTDAGLVHLKGLTGLQSLGLDSTEITDAGLVHLKGLTGLQELYLFGTEITDAGVADLQKALPNCKITK